MNAARLEVYRSCTPVVDARHEQDGDRSPSEVIIDALAEAAGVDPVDLPPLYEFVDPESLDSFFDRHDRTPAAEGILSFRVEDWNVFVRADGRIRVCDATRHTDPEPVFKDSTA